MQIHSLFESVVVHGVINCKVRITTTHVRPKCDPARGDGVKND